jgi:hypothetical protein
MPGGKHSKVTIFRAAMLVAYGASTKKVVRVAGISKKTLSRWKQQGDFKLEVERLRNRWAEQIEKTGITDKRCRLYRLNDRWRRGQAFMEKRGRLFREQAKEDPELAKVPGGEDGMVAWRVKILHVGRETYKRVIEYEFDNGYSAEMRALEEQAAMELGQYKPKQEVTFADADRPLRLDRLHRLNDDELQFLAAIARKLEADGPDAEGHHAGDKRQGGEPVEGESRRPHAVLGILVVVENPPSNPMKRCAPIDESALQHSARKNGGIEGQ